MRTARFWVPPVLGLAAAVVLLAVSLTVDSRLTWPAEPPPPLFGGSASTASTLLSAIAGAVTSLLALVFTIITVVIQLATGQYSARALRTLYTDRPSHFTIGTFVATVSYSLLLLPSVRATADPLGFSVLLAVVLAVLSVVTFAVFSHHVAHLVRVGSLTRTLAAETRRTIDDEMPHPVAQEQEQEDAAPRRPDPGSRRTVPTPRAGSLVAVDHAALVRVAEKADAVVEVLPAVGDYVPDGSPLLHVWGPQFPPRALRRAVTVDVERQVDRDVAYGLRLLTDVGLRALSPAVNDPTTAVQALDRVHDVLRLLATRAMPAQQRRDSTGAVRVLMQPSRWEDLVSLAVDEVRQAGAGQVQVLRRLRALLLDVRESAPAHRRGPLDERLALLDDAAQQLSTSADRRVAAQPDVQGLGGAGRAG
ncbi:DUF2254 domain-containing protein [Pseudokineococcus sp. 1T1Z-3]|uniref:DUF2254 domain-containing protein n=1 Tax=Pseudokineococcus sp. 1T1Z-3 TaxID=3132745 RepID=UPI00309C1BD5